MVVIESGAQWIVRLNRGERFLQCIEEFCSLHSIKSAWLQGLGGTQWLELGFYDLASQVYEWRQFDQNLELTNVTGNIGVTDAGELRIHAHATCSDSQFNAFGGHVKDFEAAGTIELLISPLEARLQRVLDNQVGLALLQAGPNV